MHNLPADPSLLAFLVNESRSRRPDLSGDDAARYWVRKNLLQSLARLWDDFSKTVYPNDDIELSIRNSYFRMKIADALKDGPGAFFNIAAGLTSYPYYLPDNCEYHEFDSELMISYKISRVEDVVRSADLERRIINYQVIDLGSSDLAEFETYLGFSKRRKVFLLEGISYYLNVKQWRSILSAIRQNCCPGDVVMFDFWHEKDSRKLVFNRFKQFVARHTRRDFVKFNFININQGDRYNGFVVHQLTDVFEQESHVRKVMSAGRLVNDLNNDLLLRNILNERSTYTMPERYAVMTVA